MIKLKQSQVKAYRDQMLKDQDGKCALCGHTIHEKACLDHAHMPPHKDKVRGVLHNHCNIFLGKLENARVRTGTHWGHFSDFAPHIYDYIQGGIGEKNYKHADWHPSKRKSEVTEFRKMTAMDQHLTLGVMQGGHKFIDTKNAAERVALFKKLNNKT